MLKTATCYRLPQATSHLCIPAIRFVSSTTTKPRTISTQIQTHHNDSNLPLDKQSEQTPGTVPQRNGIFDIATKIYNASDIEKHDDVKFLTKPAYPHVGFTEAGCQKVEVAHREPRTFGDKIAYHGIKFCRGCFDFVTGYKVPKEGESLDKYKGTRYEMTEGKWLTRVIFLELVAGVPGSVASFLRTLHSLRLLRRDKAWIETLQDEAYNERMHLLTFMKIGQPSWFTKTIIYLGQGVFTNLFFFCYLANPKYCHRFVGYLEEEAVRTYTHLLDEMEDPNKLNGFQKIQIPTIAVNYWSSLSKDSSFKDLILRIRADESKHREVNHTLANLKQDEDRNPFALQIKGLDKPQPNYGLDVVRPTGWEKKELYL